ncbi:hypothetical protein TNCT_676481 [Trichonephila clavata]|uniref:Prokineticin domain-containing protein n=1 Tax=Trichonephila clavata TaxID=2740835 RepID=A0A8X6K4R2_TRICU|nr:hypothetical protein TNCT_676481 [Trichonephila clavata]
MKVFVVALVLVACLAFCEAKSCRFTEECEEDECCLSRSIFGRGNGNCEKLTDKGENCQKKGNNFKRQQYFSRCPCLPQYSCKPTKDVGGFKVDERCVENSS